MAGAGYYNHLYEQQRAVDHTQSLSGQRIAVWRKVRRLHGSQVKPSARQLVDDAGPATRLEMNLETAYVRDLTVRDRLVDVATGDVWDITGVLEPDDGRRRRLWLQVVRVET